MNGCGSFGPWQFMRRAGWTAAAMLLLLVWALPAGVAAQEKAGAQSSIESVQPSAGPESTVPGLAEVRRRDLGSAMRVLTGWLPGVYDNHEQIVRQSGHGLMPLVYEPFARWRVDIAALRGMGDGTVAFRLTERQGPELDVVARDEVMFAAIDLAANALRLRRHAISGEIAKGVVPEAGQLTSLGDQCDLLLRYEGGQFSGEIASSSCKDHGAFAQVQWIFGQDYVWKREQARDRGGRLVHESASGTGFDWYKASRSRNFSCDIFGNPDGDMMNTEYIRTIKLHDQGDIAEFPWPDGRMLEFTIHRRAFSASPERVYPLFRVHEKGNPVPIAYAYSEDDSTRFGLNLGWFYIRCAEVTGQD